jgi:ribonuclease HII
VADFRIERECLAEGYSTVAGVDEVGRGALFGPVVAVALSFPPAFAGPGRPAWTQKINDSKLLSPKKRETLVRDILGESLSLGVGMASNAEIDAMNIYQAANSAMKRAIAAMRPAPAIVLVDGFPLKDVDYPQRGVKQGDRKSVSIAAASIVAKVLRDGLMDFFDALYAGYGLSRHKGYGTIAHYRAILELGPTCLHRRSFNLKAGGDLTNERQD